MRRHGKVACSSARRRISRGHSVSNSNSLSRGNLQLTVVIALWSVVLGRTLAEALPGSRSGLGRWLDVNHWTAGFSTQLLAVLLVSVATRLTRLTWHEHRMPYRYRVTVAPAAVIVAFLIVSACFDILTSPRTPEMSLFLGILSSVIAICAALVCLGPALIRATGFALALSAGASVAQISARLLAFQAGDAGLPTQYLVARWLATAAVVVDALSLLTVAIWAARRERSNHVLVWLCVSMSAALAYAAERGTRVHATFPEVLLSRMLAQLHREPSAFVTRIVHNAHEIFAFMLAALMLRRPRGELPELRACLALVLLARSSPDIPLCAGLLTTGAMGLALLAAERLPPAAPIDPEVDS